MDSEDVFTSQKNLNGVISEIKKELEESTVIEKKIQDEIKIIVAGYKNWKSTSIISDEDKISFFEGLPDKYIGISERDVQKIILECESEEFLNIYLASRNITNKKKNTGAKVLFSDIIIEFKNTFVNVYKYLDSGQEYPLTGEKKKELDELKKECERLEIELNDALNSKVKFLFLRRAKMQQAELDVMKKRYIDSINIYQARRLQTGIKNSYSLARQVNELADDEEKNKLIEKFNELLEKNREKFRSIRKKLPRFIDDNGELFINIENIDNSKLEAYLIRESSEKGYFDLNRTRRMVLDNIKDNNNTYLVIKYIENVNTILSKKKNQELQEMFDDNESIDDSLKGKKI